MHPMLNIAIRAAREAGNIIARAAERLDTIKVTAKGHRDFVTNIDIKAEQTIINVLRKTFPHHSILSEECGLDAKDEEFLWIIDPLDGTTNFIHGFPHFAVSIALKHNDRIEQAVIYDPIRQELFTASHGNGARLNNNTRLRVSTHSSLEHSLLGTGFPFKNPEYISPYMSTFQAFLPMAIGIRRAGSAVLDLAYIAAGRLDGFWEFGLKPWDMAAGSLIIREAGGLISDFMGTENYLDSGNIVTGNPKLFKAMLQVIQPALKT
ncbi:MAG: inositol-1-monophosphatase [Gammaproteobacteria bacterium]